MSEFASLSKQSKIPAPEILYILNPDVDLEKLLQEINLNLVEILNQITFCRIGLSKELIKLKVRDRLENANDALREELKGKYEKIQEIQNRNLLDLFMTLDKTGQTTSKMHQYNNFASLKRYLVGIIWSIDLL
jgi:hypothetical protein